MDEKRVIQHRRHIDGRGDIVYIYTPSASHDTKLLERVFTFTFTFNQSAFAACKSTIKTPQRASSRDPLCACEVGPDGRPSQHAPRQHRALLLGDTEHEHSESVRWPAREQCSTSQRASHAWRQRKVDFRRQRAAGVAIVQGGGDHRCKFRNALEDGKVLA